MIFIAVLTIAMVVFLMVTAGSALREGTTDDKAGPAEDSGPAHDVVKPETLEGVLVKQLIQDEINGLQYRRAMQRLAERDADRHPLTVPTDN